MQFGPLTQRRLLVSVTLLTCTLFSATAFGQPVADWQFNETGQTVNDASAQNNDGVLGTTVAVEGTDPARIVSVFGDALRFAGGQYVSVPSSSSLEPATVTVEAWVRSSTGGGGSFSYVLSKGADDCNAGSYGMFVGNGGGIVFMIYDGTNFFLSPESGPSLWDGQWHHVAGSYDGSDVRVYLDGVEVGTGTPSTATINYSLPTHDDLYIGAYRGSCELLFDGDIDAVRIWPRTLDAGEISASAALPPIAVRATSWGSLKTSFE